MACPTIAWAWAAHQTDLAGTGGPRLWLLVRLQCLPRRLLVCLLARQVEHPRATTLRRLASRAALLLALPLALLRQALDLDDRTIRCYYLSAPPRKPYETSRRGQNEQVARSN